jgi:cytochrome c biogenesis factor
MEIIAQQVAVAWTIIHNNSLDSILHIISSSSSSRDSQLHNIRRVVVVHRHQPLSITTATILIGVIIIDIVHPRLVVVVQQHPLPQAGMMYGELVTIMVVVVVVVIGVFIPPAVGLLRQLYQGDDHYRIILKVVVHLMVVVGVKVVAAHLRNRRMMVIEVKVVAHLRNRRMMVIEVKVVAHHLHDGMITMVIRTINLVLLHEIHPLLARIHRPTSNDDGET